MYTNVDYAHSRLLNTWVRFKGKPVLVESVYRDDESGKIMLAIKDFAADKRHKVDIVDLDLSSMPLGFVNFRGSSIFLYRMPMRNDWRQGIRSSNTGAKSPSGMMGGMNRSRVFASKQFSNSVLGVYPSMEECVEDVVNDEWMSKSFSKHFSVVKQDDRPWLVYKGDKTIAKITNKLEKPIFVGAYKHLQESFEEEFKAS